MEGEEHHFVPGARHAHGSLRDHRRAAGLLGRQAAVPGMGARRIPPQAGHAQHLPGADPALHRQRTGDLPVRPALR